RTPLRPCTSIAISSIAPCLLPFEVCPSHSKVMYAESGSLSVILHPRSTRRKRTATLNTSRSGHGISICVRACASGKKNAAGAARASPAAIHILIGRAIFFTPRLKRDHLRLRLAPHLLRRVAGVDDQLRLPHHLLAID